MPFRNLLAVVLCLLSLFILAPIRAQNEPQVRIRDAKTYGSIVAHYNSEIAKLDQFSLTPKERTVALAEIFSSASEELLEVAESLIEKRSARGMKFSALMYQMRTDSEGAEQKIDNFLKEAAAMEETKDVVEQWRFRFLVTQIDLKGAKAAGAPLETFLKEIEAKDKTDVRTTMLHLGRFFLFSEKAQEAEITPENLETFKTELKTWLGNEHVSLPEIAALGFQVARLHKVSAEQIARELTAYIQLPQCPLPEIEKRTQINLLNRILKFAVGVDPKLYGKTLDNKDFNWESLRGKYVLVQFTATWCPSCTVQIPSMIETYKKYHDKGLEIVSVYIGEDPRTDPVATVKKFVEEKEVPWIILSEALTMRGNQPRYGEFYLIEVVPTFVLADKDGKALLTTNDEADWKAQLMEIFK